MDYKKYKKTLDKIYDLEKTAKGKVSTTEIGDALVVPVKLLFNDEKYLELVDEKLRTDTCEFDLIYKNKYTDNSAILNDFGRYVVVECKNWKKSVSASSVRDYAMKLQKVKVKLGLLFSKSGITGKGSRDATGEIKFLFDKYDICIIVFGITDLKDMGDPTGTKFRDLLESKLYRRQFSI